MSVSNLIREMHLLGIRNLSQENCFEKALLTN